MQGVATTHGVAAAAAAAAGKIHWRNTRDQLQLVGPKSLGVALLTAGFVGMVFTIQVGAATAAAAAPAVAHQSSAVGCVCFKQSLGYSKVDGSSPARGAGSSSGSSSTAANHHGLCVAPTS
jgi:hypothetical protein